MGLSHGQRWLEWYAFARDRFGCTHGEAFRYANGRFLDEEVDEEMREAIIHEPEHHSVRVELLRPRGRRTSAPPGR